MVLVSSKLIGQAFEPFGKWVSSDGVYFFDFDSDGKNLLFENIYISKRFLAEFEIDDKSILKILREDGHLFKFEIVSISENEVQLKDLKSDERLTLYRVINDHIDHSMLQLDKQCIPIQFNDSITYLMSHENSYELNHKSQKVRDIKIDLIYHDCVNYILIEGVSMLFVLNFDGNTIHTVRSGENKIDQKDSIDIKHILDKRINGIYEPRRHSNKNLKNNLLLKKNLKVKKIQTFSSHDDQVTIRKNKGNWITYLNSSLLEIKYKEYSIIYFVTTEDGKYILNSDEYYFSERAHSTNFHYLYFGNWIQAK